MSAKKHSFTGRFPKRNYNSPERQPFLIRSVRMAAAGVCFICSSLRFEWLLFQVTWISRASTATLAITVFSRNMQEKLGFAILLPAPGRVVSVQNGVRRFLAAVGIACFVPGIAALAITSALASYDQSNSSRAMALYIASSDTGNAGFTEAGSLQDNFALTSELSSQNDNSIIFPEPAIPETGGAPRRISKIAPLGNISYFDNDLFSFHINRSMVKNSAVQAYSDSPEQPQDGQRAAAAKEQTHASKVFLHNMTVRTEPIAEWGGSFIWPADGPVTSWYGYRNASVGSSNHKGIDIGGSRGSSIYAVSSGEVIYSGSDGRFGNVVRIMHDSGFVTLYAHCSSLNVSKGDKVVQGQVIGGMGMTGTASGVHLHFELIIDGENVNPIRYLP